MKHDEERREKVRPFIGWIRTYRPRIGRIKAVGVVYGGEGKSEDKNRG